MIYNVYKQKDIIYVLCICIAYIYCNETQYHEHELENYFINIYDVNLSITFSFQIKFDENIFFLCLASFYLTINNFVT